ncbi:Laminin subunit gamma-3 [Frankliniella fusca]|uniref:Laminin subunit gamma-3 n=1 Tax=Frankliniella fusca TaxID=407009 RepID=A0AAE1HEH2_9NEOP|nr:Laminin subunit gamma-3 [Frankliniella fusca]
MGRVSTRKRLSRRKGDTYRTSKTSQEPQHVELHSDLLLDSEPVFEPIGDSPDSHTSENKTPNISIDNTINEVCLESVKLDHAYGSQIGSKPKFEGSAPVPEPVLDEELLLDIKHKIDFFLPHQWLCLQDNNYVIKVVLISAQNNVSIQRSLEFSHNGDINFYVHCNPMSIDPYLTETLPPLPLDASTVDYFVDRVVTIVNNVRKMEICPGYDDEKYQVAWPVCPFGEKDTNPYRECRYSETFRSHTCLRLVGKKKWRCSECAKLYKPLKRRTAAAAMETRKSKTANKYLTESQMLIKLQEQRQELDKARKKIVRLHSKMEVMIKKEGIAVEQSMSDALSEILSDSKITPAQSIFMQQQIKASQVEKSSSMRWHPTMLRLALAVHLTSPSAYELLRDTGMVKLPSSRTLFEYSHANRIKEGIDAVVIEKLSARVTKLTEEINPTTKVQDKHKKYHILMADEMYISQNLIFQKTSGKLLGFTSLDDIDSEIRNLEAHLAGQP